MLIEFSVKNFLSIKNEVTLSMEAAKIRSRDEKLNQNNVFEVSKTQLLKSAAIYGANASGKSNLLTALRFMKYFIVNSASESQVDDPINVKYFSLSQEMINKPSGFEIIFFIDKIQYRYGFEVDQENIRSEWLYYIPTSRETLLFKRDNRYFEIKGGFKEGRGLEEKTRDNALFLSVVSQFNGEISKSIIRWFKNSGMISGIHDYSYKSYTTNRLKEDSEFKKQIINIVKNIDVGISDIEVQETIQDHNSEEDWVIIRKRKKGKNIDIKEEKISTLFPKRSIVSSHIIYNINKQAIGYEDFDIEESESEGTRKLIYLLGPILSTLENGSVLLIDEFDTRFHPLITIALIKLFNSNKTNPHNAQLIFATHDTNLLSSKLFRRDQIWFTEKNRFGATDLYSLAEIKNIRNDASFEKDYIKGKYGAIPYLGNLDFLNNCEE